MERANTVIGFDKSIDCSRTSPNHYLKKLTFNTYFKFIKSKFYAENY